MSRTSISRLLDRVTIQPCSERELIERSLQLANNGPTERIVKRLLGREPKRTEIRGIEAAIAEFRRRLDCLMDNPAPPPLSSPLKGRKRHSLDRAWAVDGANEAIAEASRMLLMPRFGFNVLDADGNWKDYPENERITMAYALLPESLSAMLAFAFLHFLDSSKDYRLIIGLIIPRFLVLL